jgi:hypothetical protein
VVVLDVGKDANDYFVRCGRTVENFRQLCSRALGQGDAEASAAAEPAEPGVLTIEHEGRRYRVRVLGEGPAVDRLRVHVRCEGREGFHIDVVDLYSARARASLAHALAEAFGCGVEVTKKELLELIEPCEQELGRRLAAKKEAAKPRLTAEERELGFRFLRDPKLFERIVRDYETLGVLGEDATNLTAYLVATSRKLEEPLSLLLQSRSSAGKSAIAQATVAMMPDEARVHLTRLTPQALFYLGEDALMHRLLCVEEAAGAEGASYSLRTMQSQRELTIAATQKDARDGKLRTETMKVKGPMALLVTTTEMKLDEETKSRFLVATVDESTKQTERILMRQREGETLAGLQTKLLRDEIVKRHHAAQRSLREDLLVVNPLAPGLSYPELKLRARRDQKKMLSLLRAIAYLRQDQKEMKTTVVGTREVAYVEVDPDDVAIARKLAPAVLGPTLDELSVPARRLLEELGRLRKAVTNGSPRRFSRREIREATGWSDYQVRTHLEELCQLEYVACGRGGRKGVKYEYELCDGAEPPEVPEVFRA